MAPGRGPDGEPVTPSPASVWYLYLVECERGVLYAGITPDVERRFARHRCGKGAAFTRINRPLRILATAAFPDRGAATRAEISLKKMTRDQKLRWARENAWPERADAPSTHFP